MGEKFIQAGRFATACFDLVSFEHGIIANDFHIEGRSTFCDCGTDSAKTDHPQGLAI